MGIKDLFITPIYIILFSILAYWIRPYVTNLSTSKFFLPALWAKFIGAIFLGLLYQFYYGGGDTFNYFTHGSKYIWEAFQVDFDTGLQLLFESGGSSRQPETFAFSQHIWYYRDPNSFIIVRLTALFDLITLHTYSSTALFFALFSFSGCWVFYHALQKLYPEATNRMAIAILFIPSVIFWGSGILKDTITLGALGWMTWGLINLIEFNRIRVRYIVGVVFAAFFIYQIKIYILICYLPLVFVWIYWKRILAIRSGVIRVLIAPILLVFFGLIGFFALNQISEQNQKYSIDNIAERARITAYDIRYGWGARTGGEGGYDIGLPDGTVSGMLRLMPAAINVSLFRPYIWEVRNPLMLLSALESLIILMGTGLLFFRKNRMNVINDPFLVFCLLFSILFAFAVGVSTFNFGTLMRYKMPALVFYCIFLILTYKKTYQNN